VWEKEYSDKKNDPKFLADYMDKRSKLGMPNALLFDQYLKLMPEKERTSEIVVKLYRNTVESLKVNSFAYTNLKKNKNMVIGDLSGLQLLYIGISNSVSEAAKSKNEQLLTTAMSVYDQLPKGVSTYGSKDELYMQYFQRTKETVKYVKHASSLGNNHLLKLTDDTIASRDQAGAALFEKRMNAGEFVKLDSAQIARYRAYTAHAERDRISQSLNNIAWTVFEKTLDKKALQDALLWSKRSRELSPDNSGYLDTYANLLYKLGRKEEAIKTEKEALGYDAKANKEPDATMVEVLRKMIADEKTWND